jgi:hypothetical protein
MHINVTMCPSIRQHYSLAWTSRCMLQCYKWIRNCRQPRCLLILLLFMTQQSLRARASLSRFRDHTQDTPHSIRLLWTSDQPGAETSNLTAHKTHTRQAYMPLAGFEPAIPANERQQTHALDCAATGIASIAVRPY